MTNTPRRRKDDDFIESLDSRLMRIENFLYLSQNGDSMSARIKVLEERTGRIEKTIDLIPCLDKKLSEHIEMPHTWHWVKKPKNILGIIGGGVFIFFVLHSLFTYFTEIWNIIVIALKLPFLVIPIQ